MPAPHSPGLLPEVRYTFTVRDHASIWTVRRVELREALCEPYRLCVELLSDDPELAPDDLLGADARLTLARDGAPARDVLGVVLRVDQLARRGDHRSLRLEVGPALALSAHQVGTRGWQDKNVPQILKEVVGTSLAALGRRVRFDLDPDAYRVREYCVQYRESDLTFVRRLVQEDGLAFRFEHTDDAETLVFFDSNDRCPALDPVPFVPRGAPIAAAESIDRIARIRQLGATGVSQRDWSPMTHNTEIEHTRLGHDARGRQRIHHKQDDRRVDDDDQGLRVLHDSQRHDLMQDVFRGAGDVLAFTAGQRFTLGEHPDFDGDYLISRVEHHAEIADAGHDEAPTYSNSFTCAPLRYPYRLDDPQLARPRVHGPHTAIVASPDDRPGDIHIDNYGRIKVRFDWAHGDSCETCWVRVAQTWASIDCGAVFIPRANMEVVVEFLDGDPDRPLVTGCVYAPYRAPPFYLPEHKTRSGIISESVPGGGIANQILLEDARGRESLSLKTRRDLHTTAGHDHTATVAHDQTTHVGANQITAVVGNCELLVQEGDHKTRVVKGAHSTDVEADHSTYVRRGDSHLQVDHGHHHIQALKHIYLASGTDDIVLAAHRSVLINAKTSRMQLLALEGIQMISRTNDVKIGAQRDAELLAHSGRAHVTGPEVALTATADVDIFASGEIRTSSLKKTSIGASEVILTAEDSIELRVGTSSIKITPNAITLHSACITSNAVGEQTISGAIIRLN